MYNDQNNNNRLSIRRDAVARLLRTSDQKIKIIIFTQDDQVLGQGSYGKCYPGIIKNQSPSSIQIDQKQQQINPNDVDLTNQNVRHNIVVVKEIKKQKKDINQQDQYKREIQNLFLVTQISANHKNLVRCYPYTISSQHSYYMVMQYCEGKSLDRLMNKRLRSFNWFNFFQFLKIFSDIISGYYPLNKVKIMHEDLKPQNIFIKDKNFKIGDFGLSFLINKQKFRRAGTQSYNGIQKYKDRVNVSQKSDIYAMGVIFYKLFYGVHPYYQRLQYQVYRGKAIEALMKQRGLTKQKFRPIGQDESKIFIKFYDSRNLKTKDPFVSKYSVSQDFKHHFGHLLAQIYDKIQTIIKQMVHKDIDYRPSFTDVHRFLKENKILQILEYAQQSKNINQETVSFFEDLNQNNPDTIQLPLQFSQIGQHISFEQVSDIEAHQVQLQNTLLRTSSHNQQRNKMLAIKFPKVFQLKKNISKINVISRFLMQAHHQLSFLDLGLIFRICLNKKNDKLEISQENRLTVETNNQKQSYEQKKVQLQFVVEKYLLSFLKFIKQSFDSQIKKFNQAELDLYYRENIDLLLQVLQKNEQFLDSQLFISVQDLIDFKRNQNDLQKVICDQFLNNIGLDSKNLVLAYYCLTILRIKDEISFYTSKLNQNQIQQSLQRLASFEELKIEWDQFIHQFTILTKNKKSQGFSFQKIKKFVSLELKNKNIVHFPFFD